MNRKLMALGFGFVVAVLIAAGGWSFACGDAKDEKTPPAKKPTKEEIHKLMVKAHKGKDSPLARTKADLKNEKPNWEQLAKDAKVFVEMGEALKGKSGYTNPKGYIDSSVAFGKAVDDKDVKKADEAFTKLNQSCSACHYGVPK